MIKKAWTYGTSTPVQRAGVIILLIGLLSLSFWMGKEGLDFEDILNPYYSPSSRDSFFFHLYVYLIPLGLLMSWGNGLLIKIKNWVMNDRDSNIESNANHLMHFENNLKAFQFAADSYIPDLTPKKISIGLIQDRIQLKDGSTQVLVQLASKERTILVSGFNDKYSNSLGIGDLVYWGFVEPIKDEQYLHIEAIGHVVAILESTYNADTSKWSIKKDLTK